MRKTIVCLSLFALLITSAAFADDRPNILFAFADDWGKNASIYAELESGTPNDVVRTPNFDRMAKEGVLFTNAYVNAPSCTPCRSALLSGEYFFRTGLGAILQGAVWDSKIPSYPLILKESGYHIGHTYKVWSPGTPANAPYGAKATAYGSAGSKFNGFSQFVSQQPDIKAGKQKLLDEVEGNFDSFLKDRKPGQPFCYWFGPTNVHRKWIQGSGKKLWGIDPDDLKGKLPPFLPDAHVVREDFADYLGEVHAFDLALGLLISKLEAMGELDNTIVVVSGDHGAPGFPRGKCNLYDFGVSVSLAIRWGDEVKGGRVVNDFVNLMDLAPTFVEAGNQQPPQVMTGRSLIGLLKSGKSGQVDAKRDYVVTGRERHVAAARTGMKPYPQRAIRTNDFLYIRNFKPERWPMGNAKGYGRDTGTWPDANQLTHNTFSAFGDLDASPTKAYVALECREGESAKYFDFAFGRRPGEELYDLKNDPHQINNVATESAFSDAKQELSARLIKILKQNKDPRVTGDGSTFENPPYTGQFRKPARPAPKKK